MAVAPHPAIEFYFYRCVFITDPKANAVLQ